MKAVGSSGVGRVPEVGTWGSSGQSSVFTKFGFQKQLTFAESVMNVSNQSEADVGRSAASACSSEIPASAGGQWQGMISN